MCFALNIFSKFTNKEIVVKAMSGEIKPGGVSRKGTVLFSDIHEYTKKMEEFYDYYGAEASEKIVLWLNKYFTKMVDCVDRTYGVVDKFIGDTMMSHWGIACSEENPRKDAFNCVKAALMMRKEVYYLNKSRRVSDPANPVIRIGCGINSGIVTAGQVGSETRMDYTIIGDPVNLASLIERQVNSLKVDILISEETYRLTGDKFLCQEMPPITVKGKTKPIRVYAVINFNGEIKGPQSIEELRSLLGFKPE